MFNERNFDWDSYNQQAVLDGQGALERTNESIIRSTQIAVETENIGTQVVSELNEQRETLLRTKGRLTNANEQLDSAKNVLRKMSRNVVYNKVILILIIVLEIAILLTASYLKFFRK